MTEVMHLRTILSVAAITATAGALVSGCKPRPAPPESDAASSSAASSSTASWPGDSAFGREVVREIPDTGPLAAGIPVPQAILDAEINPNGLPAFDGPVGTVAGIVRIKGDQAPKIDVTIPFECAHAAQTYGRAFREGPGRTVADVLVAVTGYEGYLPPRSNAVPIAIAGCAYDRRTIGMMFGQFIAVTNTDRNLSFVPTLLGADLPAELVALPRGDAVRLYPKKVGHYVLGDAMNRTWMRTDVFVVRYRTQAVTGIDGAFRIEGVPTGKLSVVAYLPAIDAGFYPDVGVAQPATEKFVDVKAGETAEVELTLDYKRPKAKPAAKAPAAPTPNIH